MHFHDYGSCACISGHIIRFIVLFSLLFVAIDRSPIVMRAPVRHAETGDPDVDAATGAALQLPGGYNAEVAATAVGVSWVERPQVCIQPFTLRMVLQLPTLICPRA